MPSRPRAAHGEASAETAGSYKRKREAQLKATAGSSHNWNPLFMRAEAVGEAMASRYAIDKRDVLDVDADGGSLAVRLAQGETHLIAQAKKWLGNHGVSIQALEAMAKATPSGGFTAERSQTLIIVKNLDASITHAQLEALFSRHGQLAHVLLAPANTLALVEFLEVGEAKRAFRALAYSKCNGVPLYLEWAPVRLLESGARAEQPGDTAAVSGAAVVGADTDAAAGGAGQPADGDGEDADEDHAETEGCTLFVKNLNFKTEDAALRALFEHNFTVRSASVVHKRDPHSGARTMSMGYGFVELSTPAEAAAALRRMNGARLDDHILQLKLSARSSARASAPPAAASSTSVSRRSSRGSGAGRQHASNKLVVRNVPFEASKREVRELFSAFGQLKTLRLPKKFDGSHRGFAFVELVSKSEAAKAMEALQSTHLYGRKLVVQYADEQNSVEAMRQKVRDVFEAPPKRAKSKKAADKYSEGGEFFDVEL